MDPIFSQEPVSSEVPEFRHVAESALPQSPLVILLRYANRGGAKSDFVARSIAEFETIIADAPSKTSITMYLPGNFVYSGIVDTNTASLLIQALPDLDHDNEGMDIICVDAEDVSLGRDEHAFLKSAEDVESWTTRNQGRSILAGMLPFWLENCDDVLTVYVPDGDGVVRPGAY